MKTSEETKKLVREKYSEIASADPGSKESCCDSACCSVDGFSVMSEDYKSIEGYIPEADLGLGCGLPTQFAKIEKGDSVLDLGSGAGNDCFIARNETGESGSVIGVDMTPTMIEKARSNAKKLNFNNVEFRLGEIESLPVEKNSIDVVISNCVLNLVPDKKKSFQEIMRVLKDGGHFSISDVVLIGELPEKIIDASEMYAGCVSGAIQKDEYMRMVQDAGFINIQVQKEKAILIPDSVFLRYLSEAELKNLRESGAGIYSITLYAEKPKSDCCDKDTCCK